MMIHDKDPVCGMPVKAHTFTSSHAGIRYVFCSSQCLERFEQNPHLYIGYPGHQAPKQRGMKVLKRRRFSLETPLSTDECAFLTKSLHEMMGILEVQTDGLEITVIYDLLEVTSEQIEAQLRAIGASLGGQWPERLHRGFIHFIEESEIAGLDEPPP